VVYTLLILTVGTHRNLKIPSHRSLLLKLHKESITRIHVRHMNLCENTTSTVKWSDKNEFSDSLK
jgi:hypothetical protein